MMMMSRAHEQPSRTVKKIDVPALLLSQCLRVCGAEAYTKNQLQGRGGWTLGHPKNGSGISDTASLQIL